MALSSHLGAQTSSTVLVSLTSSNATALNQGFAGFTTELLGSGIEYGDTNLDRFAQMLSPGWLLFPAGTSGDAFNWSTGLTESNWVQAIGARQGPNNNASNLCSGTYNALLGKGGAMFTNFANMAVRLGGARIIVCINGFTDTPESAGAFAAFALGNHLAVAAWELCNEPYLFQGTNNFFTNGTDYAVKMLPFRNAIKAADSNAVVAVFFSDPNRPGTSWDNDLKKYSPQYWDAVVYHHYPLLPTNSSFADLMAMDNGILFSNTAAYITNTLIAKNTNSSVTFLLTEFNPAEGNGAGGQFPPTSTLYGGIYASEYLMRLSAVPRVSFAGSYQLVNGCGVDTTNQFWNAVTKAAAGGYVTNTAGLPFGYFLSAQGSGEAVAYWALNRSVSVYPTSVSTNGPTVPMDTNRSASMPALYAQAYQGGNGKRYVLLTNKGSNAVPVQIVQDGVALTNTFVETFLADPNPAATNSNPPFNNVQIQSAVTSNPVSVPGYSVTRLEWTVFAVPKPSLSLKTGPSSQALSWTGLTNVIYRVQTASNLAGPWTTVGAVTSPQGAFSFPISTNRNAMFYRLAVLE